VARIETLVQHAICIGVTSRRMEPCLQQGENVSLQSLRLGHCDNFHESKGRRFIMSVLFNHFRKREVKVSVLGGGREAVVNNGWTEERDKLQTL
jgi:hypothetical protein